MTNKQDNNVIEVKTDLTKRLAALTPEQKARLALRLKQPVVNQEKPVQIVPRPRNEPLPLSFSQQRIWFLNQLMPGSHTINALLRLTGVLKVDILPQVIDQIIERHEILRTTFAQEETQFNQTVLPHLTIEIPIIDLRTTPQDDQIAQARQQLKTFQNRPFDLKRGPLLRVYLFELAEQDYLLAITMHNMAFDAWSVSIFIRELIELYQAKLANRPHLLAPLTIQYADYAYWQHQKLQGQFLENLLSYWRNKLANITDLALPTDHLRPVRPVLGVKRHSIFLSPEITKGIKQLTKQTGITLYMVVLAAFNVLLYKYTNQTDISVGCLVANRSQVETERLIGFFSNLIVFRADLNDNPSFLALLNRIQTVVIEAYKHEDLPFDKLVEHIHPERRLNQAPLVKVGCLLQSAMEGTPEVPQLKIQFLENSDEVGALDLVLSAADRGEQMSVTLIYSLDLFEPDTIKRMLAHYAQIMTAIVADSQQTISEISLLAADDYRISASINASTGQVPTSLLHTPFIEQAINRPEQPAIISNQKTFTYQNLDQISEQIARYLVQQETKVNELVAIVMKKGWEQVAAVLAILKAGAAYLPIDATWPQERIDYLLHNCNVRIVLSQPQLRETISWPANINCLFIDESLEQPLETRLTPLQKLDDLAYVIFTSGSTGLPKGVMIDHQGAWNTIYDINQRFSLTSSDRVLALSALNFDLSVYDIFGLLAVGGTIVIPEELATPDPAYWAQLLQNHKVTVWNSVPAMMQMLTDYLDGRKELIGDSLRLIMLSGDWIPVNLPRAIKELDANLELVSLGGATEASIWSIIYPIKQLKESWKSIPYGKAMLNQQFYVLDNRLELCPVGIPGNLYIGGIGLAKGYWQDLEKTSQSFITHPKTGERLYKTGDLGRYLADENIEFLGRQDFQVKIRGYRIELGEIEAALEKCAGVKMAIVVAVGEKNERQLVGYLVPSANNLTIAEVKRELQTRLPDYMVPAYFVVLKEFPLTNNGKVDRQALQKLPTQTAEQTDIYTQPTNSVEELLVKIWQKLLNKEDISTRDNFFELGGHSLLATQLVSKIRQEIGVELPLRVLFEAPRLTELATRILEFESSVDTFKSDNLPTVVNSPEERHKPFPLTNVQQAYFMGRGLAFELGNISTHFYTEININDLDIDRFRQAWQKVIERHEMLRAIVLPNGEQVILPNVPAYQIELYNLIELSEEDSSKRLLEIRKEMSHQVLKTDEWPLFDIRISLVTAEHTRVHFSIDLLIADAWSFGILGKDLFQYYYNINQDLAPLELSYRDYIIAEVSLKGTDTYQQALAYWHNRLADFPSRPELPLAKPPAALSQPRFVRYSNYLAKEKWQKLTLFGKKLGVTPSAILLTAYAETLSAWSKNSRFIINLTLFNRMPLHPQINQIIGDFTSLIPLEVDFRSINSFKERVHQVQTQLWNDLDNRYISAVEVVREYSKMHGVAAAGAMPIVFTSMLGLTNMGQEFFSFGAINKDRPANEAKMKAAQGYSITQTPQVWLDHQVTEREGMLSFNWDVVEELFPEGMITEMFNSYCTLLNTLADSADSWETTIDLLPEKERNQHQEVNQTEKALVPQLLHEIFSQTAQNLPAQLAIITPESSWTYHELDTITNQLGNYLRNAGAIPNQLVAIVMEKGWEQVVAALGILKAGAAYLPIEATLPPERIGELLKLGKVAHALIQAKTTVSPLWPSDITYQVVSSVELANHSPKPLSSHQSVSDLAYVIFTSGSTGTPKGVMIDHIGAHNTIVDINERFGVHPQDRVFALSSLSFDLSVYDLFGSLAVGATLVIPEASSSKDPAHWVEMVDTHKVTIWNSVPALMQMLVEYIEGQKSSHLASLRLIMMSGDWIPVSLPDRIKALIKDITVISLGGATEASIWSIIYPIGTVDKQWKSIPYGKPMVNQQFYVLNQALQQTPNWVVGELYIGGIGLAKGYWQDPIKTAEKFIETPTGQRLYRTGDLGRYLADGNIEFLGREDFQVKIQGYRIELGEIEAVLEQCPGVKTGVVAAIGEDRHNRKLVGYIVAEQTDLDLSVVKAYLQQRLPEYMVPTVFSLIDTLPLSPNGKVDRTALLAINTPSLKTTTRTEDETNLSAIGKEVLTLIKEALKTPHIYLDTNLFEIGATSIEIMRLANLLESQFHYRPKLGELMSQPTVGYLVDYFERNSSTEVPYSEDTTASMGALGTNIKYDLILDPVARTKFKDAHLGIRKTANHTQLSLPDNLDEDLLNYYRKRKSYRQFQKRPIPFATFSKFISGLRQVEIDGTTRALHASAGGVYSVQTYLYVKPMSIEGVAAGAYYYHPEDNSLVLLSDDVDLNVFRNAYSPLATGRPIFDEAAFAILLVVELAALLPLYGQNGVAMATIEAGLMSQVLETTALANGLGLCNMGALNFELVKKYFQVNDSHLYLHNLVGGLVNPIIESNLEDNNDWEEGQI